MTLYDKLWKLADIGWHIGCAHDSSERLSHAQHREDYIKLLIAEIEAERLEALKVKAALRSIVETRDEIEATYEDAYQFVFKAPYHGLWNDAHTALGPAIAAEPDAPQEVKQ